DTTAGHWEIAGVTLAKPFPVFPDGFPPAVMTLFEERIGRGTLANSATSGTVVIDEFGEEHVRTGKPIIYTSADSVFQIAAHEDVIPVETLYEQCEIAREILQGEWAVARVIARPFVGEPGSWKRTANRRDYSLSPFRKNVFESIEEAGWPVHGIGKIHDIFTGRGIGRTTKAGTNEEGIAVVLDLLDREEPGVLFVNLNDFDSKWGHRNDPESFARGLERFDEAIPDILKRLTDRDLLIITADHGNDPTTPGTDHSRELVPLLVRGPGFAPRDLGTRDTFADAGQTIARHFGVSHDGPGVPMQSESAN
ncbi:MAG: phosphopentomutase, partial [Gemmatimonadetes bacterium]|nr:phosphopentomutase [Gemmatimonadota bacterium]